MANLASTHPLLPRDLFIARQRIASISRRTPLVEAPCISSLIGADVHLKLENLQVTRSFKIRGATNKILSLSEEERATGVITVSSGNHGRAISYAARKLGLRVIVCLSKTVPANKVSVISSLGAEVVISGDSYDEAEAYALRLQNEQGLTMIHPFDDPNIISGQGTIGLEIMECVPRVDNVIVPLSGGGLLSGIAFALKSFNPKIHVVGVSMERGPAMVESLKAGHIVDIVEEPTLADALMGGIGVQNRYTFAMIQQYVDETVLVSEEEIAQAMIFALERHHLVVEGGGAVGLAAILSKKVKHLGKQIVVVISGGNIDIPLLIDIYQKQASRG